MCSSVDQRRCGQKPLWNSLTNFWPICYHHKSTACSATSEALGSSQNTPGSAHCLHWRMITKHSLCLWGLNHTTRHLGCATYTLVAWPVLSSLTHDNVSWVVMDFYCWRRMSFVMLDSSCRAFKQCKQILGEGAGREWQGWLEPDRKPTYGLTWMTTGGSWEVTVKGQQSYRVIPWPWITTCQILDKRLSMTTGIAL